MKKSIRSILSLLLVMVFAFQFSGSLAWADDADVTVTGNEALVYELYLPDPEADGKLIPVSADQETEKLNGKTYSIQLVKAGSEDAPVALSRSVGSAVLNDLLKADLVITPPEGFYVSQLYLRGDALETQSPKALPFLAEREKASLTLKAGAVAAKDKTFDKTVLTTYSTVDPQIYALVVVLSPVKTDSVTVKTAPDQDAAGTETQVAAGEAFTAPEAPVPNTNDRRFDAWKVSYASGGSFTLNPGESFRPYADCRVVAQWIEIITITASEPVAEGDGFAPNGYTYTGKLIDGDAIASVELRMDSDGSQYFSVPSQAVIRRGEEDVTSEYELRYVNSAPVTKEAEPTTEPTTEPDPEPAPVVKTPITITANAPTLGSDGKTYEPAGAMLTGGALNEGDSITALSFDVKQIEDGSYVSVPRDAVIKNGDTDNTANYDVTYVQSTPVKPAAPEKVKLTITANPPVLGSDGKTYEAAGAVLSAGALNEGDSFAALGYDVKQTEDGSYVSVPRDAVIKNGDTDNTANYDITYVQSTPVKPAAEKIAITIRSKDRSAEYTGKLITADSYELVIGALAQGDTMEVKYEGGSTNVTANPVASTISSVLIKDSAGNDVTASKYAVTIDNDNAGKVTVTKRAVTVTAITGTVETDGTKVIYASECKTANGSFTKGHKVEGLLSGHELRGNFVKGSGKETFTTSIDLNELRIVDTANSETDVTANYNIKTVDGKMTIKVSSKSGVPVAVTVKDQTLTYDGAAHKPDQSQQSVSGLLDGDVAAVTLMLKQGDSQVESATKAGTYTIIPVVSIKTKDGEAVAENKYSITTGTATLTIKKLDITLEAISDSKPYDGKALVNDKVKAPSLASGHKYQGVKLNVYDAKGNLIKNGAKEVGTYTKKITEVHIVDANGTEVTENYNITLVDGKLTITNSSMNNSTGPKTGDASNTIYIVLMIASLLLLGTIIAYLLVQKRKKRAAAAEANGEYFEADEQPADWQQPEADAEFSIDITPENWTASDRDWTKDPYWNQQPGNDERQPRDPGDR